MALFFCCICHELTVSDLKTDESTFVCSKCEQEEKNKTGKSVSAEPTGKRMEICTISEWELE